MDAIVSACFSMETSLWTVDMIGVARVSSKSAESCPEAAFDSNFPIPRLKISSAEHAPDFGDFQRIWSPLEV